MSAPLRARLLEVLEDYVVTDPVNQGLHGWRCQYPESYGPCDCVEQLLSALVEAVGVLAPASVAAAPPVMTNAIGGPQTARGVR